MPLRRPAVTASRAVRGGKGGAQRTGPIGRLARLTWAIVVGATLVSLVDARGPARFRDPHVLTEPSAWLLHVLMFVLFVLLVRGITEGLSGRRAARRVQVGALVVLGSMGVIAGAIDLLAEGAPWGLALGGLLWTFDVLMLAEELVAFALAIWLGTPGCEIGVWPELLFPRRGQRSRGSEGLACIVGLDLIDRWEAARRRSRDGDSGDVPTGAQGR